MDEKHKVVEGKKEKEKGRIITSRMIVVFFNTIEKRNKCTPHQRNKKKLEKKGIGDCKIR